MDGSSKHRTSSQETTAAFSVQNLVSFIHDCCIFNHMFIIVTMITKVQYAAGILLWVVSGGNNTL